MKKFTNSSTNNPYTNDQQLSERSPVGRRLISCYQLQIKTRPRELLFSWNKKKNFNNLPTSLSTPSAPQPFSPFPPLLSLSSPAITAKAAVLKSRLLFEGTKEGGKNSCKRGRRMETAGNSAGTARRPRDFLRSSGFCSRRTRCNLKRDEEAKQTSEGRRLCPIPSSNLVSANPMLGQRKRQRSRDYYVVLAGIGVRRLCLPIAIP